MKKPIQLTGLLLSAALIVLARDAVAQDASGLSSPPRTYGWWAPERQITLPPEGKLIPEETVSGKLVPAGQHPNGQFSYALEIENTNDRPLTIPLLKILDPGLSNLVYAVNGSIKYDDVAGDAYLEMWSYFPPKQPGLPEGQYFSRTLGETGPMQKITGTSDWRNFSLPFDRTGTATAPTRLEINLVLPGRGTVYLRPINLDEYSPNNQGPQPVSAGWWPETAAPWIGGIGGPVIGCFGGLLGVLAGKGVARRLVLAIWRCLIAAGVISLIAAIVGFVTRQPDFVTTPLLIFGIILTTVMGAIWPTAKRRYDELEIRRMASMDAMRG
jgi:hypothetical protein